MEREVCREKTNDIGPAKTWATREGFSMEVAFHLSSGEDELSIQPNEPTMQEHCGSVGEEEARPTS